MSNLITHAICYCPVCGKRLGRTNMPDRSVGPVVGTLTICTGCWQPLRFTAGPWLERAVLTPEECEDVKALVRAANEVAPGFVWP